MDWTNLYSSSTLQLTITANKGFITTLFAAVCCWLLFVLANKAENEPLLPPETYQYTTFVLLFLAGLLEINHQFLTRYTGTDLNYLYLMLYVPVFIYVFVQIVSKVVIFRSAWEIEALVCSFTIFVYLLFTPRFFNIQDIMLVQHKADTIHFIAHWIGVIFMLLIFYRLVMLCKANMEEYFKPAIWILSATIVLFFSIEASLGCNLIFYSPGNGMGNIETIYIKTGLPVLWGCSSFALMWLGMRYKMRVLRIISLTLFTITLVKLFAFDIENIPAAGKIAAFFCLGVLLLIISFMYQKVKNIIADDEDKSES
ncbi:MAG: DUF2339 domain-containing protein, partial [Mucilaginibacter sp.]